MSEPEDKKNEQDWRQKPQHKIPKKEDKETPMSEENLIATHTLDDSTTLSHLSLKYYGHATEEYWRIIYEANKDVIGDDPNKVRPGMELKIPVLPSEDDKPEVPGMA